MFSKNVKRFIKKIKFSVSVLFYFIFLSMT